MTRRMTRRHRRPVPGRTTLVVTGIAVGMCLLGLVVTRCAGEQADQGAPVPAGTMAVTDDQRAGYLAHLHARGVRAGRLGDADTVRLGALVCLRLGEDERVTVGSVLPTVDRFTGNRAESAVVADAAISHLCPGVEL